MYVYVGSQSDNDNLSSLVISLVCPEYCHINVLSIGYLVLIFTSFFFFSFFFLGTLKCFLFAVKSVTVSGYGF